MNKPVPLCWHCNTKFSTLNLKSKLGERYWSTLIEIEPGRFVKVHKTCQEAALRSIRKLTAAPPVSIYVGDIDGN